MNEKVKQLLVEKLYSKNLVVFLGAGASRTYHKFNGVPSAKEIVENLNKQKTYIDKKMTFPQAMFMVKKKESSNELIRVLTNIFNNLDNKKTLPVYDLLAKMPISAFITTNYDQLLENSLKNENKEFITIIEENDVSFWKNSDLPLIKIHGCISRPDTIIAAEDQYRPLYSSKPLISAMLTTFLANKTLLFLGFSLADDDFKNFYQEIKIHLQDYMPKSYSIVDDCDSYQEFYWKEQGVEIIKQDLTYFVKELFSVKSNNDFETLKISTQPSETKVIDTFLSTLLRDVQNEPGGLQQIITKANDRVNSSLNNKPNLYALKNIWNKMSSGLKKAKSIDDAENKIRAVIDKRAKCLRNIVNQSKNNVEKNDTILIYSQSRQVLEVLKNVPADTQRSCKLYICECRPKSPEAFQDALEIYKYLEQTNYNMILIPDVAAGHFIKDINKVMLGTHAVFFKNDTILSFVNTCGSAMLYQLCLINNKKLFVIADSSKFVHLKDSDEEYISDNPDEDIFKSENLNKIGLNIGYDLIKWDKTVMRLLSDQKNIDKNK